MELVVLGHAGRRVLVFPTRCGRFFDYENFGMLGALRDRVEAGQLQLFCVDSLDAESFYCTWAHPAERIRRHVRYEEYLLNEVIPFSAHVNPAALTAHGCSLGAYHAVNVAFRHPHLFEKVVGLSGRYDLCEPIADFRGLFDGWYDDTIYYHMPSHYLPNLADERMLAKLRRMHIVLVVGREDPFLGNNEHLSREMWRKGVGHELHLWDGRAHCPRRWCEMVRLYL
jgi:esterase/lipase superfamily enzyme